MRVFAALPLPHSVRAGLAAALEPMRAAHAGVRWAAPDGYHVTLHFFGDVTERQLADLKASLADPRLKVPSFAARLGTLGQFPARGVPRVVWVSLSQGGEEAAALWELVERVIEPLGWRRDPRGFTPHVTVGRAGRGGAEPVDPAGVALPADPFRLEEIVLFESVLGPHGATYRPEIRIALEGSRA